ncbi:UNVERIFIED_ORG: hypothetical protein FHR35_000470 [Microbispora rosea subsp. rosea]
MSARIRLWDVTANRPLGLPVAGLHAQPPTALCAPGRPMYEANWKIHIPMVPYRKIC